MKICSFNSLFKLQAVKNIKSNLLKCEILRFRKKYISTNLQMPEKEIFLLDNDQCTALFQAM